MACVSRSTFHKHQPNYVIPQIVAAYNDQQLQLIQELRGMDGGLELSGDGRNDSPGHSAKYQGYNINEQRLNKVLDIQLVQVSINYCDSTIYIFNFIIFFAETEHMYMK